MSHKSFKTLDEQIEILESRNVFIGDKKEAKKDKSKELLLK